jgi:hypothetical protein
LKCLEKNPAHRYPSAAALAEDLDRFLNGEPVAARKMTLVDQMVRLLGHSQLDADFGGWAKLTFWMAPLPLLIHALVFAFFQNEPEYPLVALGVSMTMIAGLLYWLIFRRRGTLRGVAPLQRRQLQSIWLGDMIGVFLVPLTILRMTHPSSPEEWFVIYPLWMIAVGAAFFSLASHVGALYVTGSLCFLLALLVPFVPYYLPLIVGSLISLNLTTVGFILRRAAREAASQ